MRLRRFVLGGAASAMGFGVGTLVLIAAESWLAKHRRYVSSDEAPIVSGSFGTGAEVRLVIFGDSTAVGLGVSATEETVGGRLAELLAGTGKRVRLDSMAVSGARAADLEAQVARALVHGIPDVAVVIIGGEDATRLAPLETFESDVAAAVSRLTAAGAAVVVATCPDLGAAQNFAQASMPVTSPVASTARSRGRELDPPRSGVSHASEVLSLCLHDEDPVDL